MKMNRFLLLLIAITMGLCSCSSGGGEKIPENPSSQQEKAKIEILSSSPTIEQVGGTVEITFTSNVAWNASVGTSSSWCSCTPNQGSAGTCTVTVTVKENDSFSERSAQLNITGGAAKQGLKITQKGKIETKPEGDIDDMPVHPL